MYVSPFSDLRNFSKWALRNTDDTADHSFKILKRTRTATESVYEEAARIAAVFIRQLLDEVQG